MKVFLVAARLPVLCFLVSLLALPAPAQYTDPTVISDLGGPQEFARRRQELAKQLKTGHLILFARTMLPEANHYREDNDFFYFTGLAGAVMVMDASNGDATIFEPQQSPRAPHSATSGDSSQARWGFGAGAHQVAMACGSGPRMSIAWHGFLGYDGLSHMKPMISRETTHYRSGTR